MCKVCAQQIRLQNMSLNQHGSDAWSSDSKSSDKKISDESSDKNSDWVCWAFPARTLWSALAFSRVLWIAKSTENFHYFFKSSFSIPTLQWCPRYELQVPMKGEGMGGIRWAARKLAFPLLCIALHCIALQGTSQCAFPLMSIAFLLHCCALLQIIEHFSVLVGVILFLIEILSVLPVHCRKF